MFAGSPDELERATGTTGLDSTRLRRFFASKATEVRWLLIKDVRILQRSPLLVALLVIYPVVIAVLIGFALSRGPDKPEVAFYNGLSEGATVELGGEEIDLTRQGSRLF